MVPAKSIVVELSKARPGQLSIYSLTQPVNGKPARHRMYHRDPESPSVRRLCRLAFDTWYFEPTRQSPILAYVLRGVFGFRISRTEKKED